MDRHSQTISKEAVSNAFRSLEEKEEINKNGSKDLEPERFKNSPDYVHSDLQAPKCRSQKKRISHLLEIREGWKKEENCEMEGEMVHKRLQGSAPCLL